MEWENKTIMTKLGNEMNFNSMPNNIKNFQCFVLEHVNSFDVQALEMFITIIELTPDNIKKDIDFYIPVYNKLHEILKDENTSFGLRAAMRLSLFEVLVEEIINK
jgi:hypothetical protein